MGEIHKIIGPPGCGKTTFLCKNAGSFVTKHGSDSVLICSLTKAAAAEVKRRRLPINPDCVGTMHSHCHRLLGRPTLAAAKIDEWNQVPGAMYLSGGGEMEGSTRGESEGDKLMEEYQTMRAGMRPRRMWRPDLIPFAEMWEDWKESNGYLDYEDLIERATRDFDRPPGDPWVVYLDEAQDSSASELELAMHWSKRCDLIVVGDPDQAIFTWRGASPRKLASLPVKEENRRVLGQSYRVPIKVRDFARKLILRCKSREDSEYRPTEVEGSVLQCSSPYRDGKGVVDFSLNIRVPKVPLHTVMFLASCNYQLVPILNELKSRSIPFHNPYRKSQASWNPLGSDGPGVSTADRLAAFLNVTTTGRWPLEDLRKWIPLADASLLLERGAKTTIDKWHAEGTWPIENDVAMLFKPGKYAEALNAGYSGDLAWFLKHVLASKQASLGYLMAVMAKRGIEALKQQPRVIVGTIHSVKGGEADVVVITPELSSSGFEDYQNDPDATIRQFYVGVTRAKNTLVIARPGHRLHVRL